MYSKIIYKNLELNDKFNVAFPDGFIPMGIIDKTKTRVGITYTAFHEPRHTFTIIPSVAIIDDAISNYPHLPLLAVYEGTTYQEIKEYMQSDVEYKKILSTPESFFKIITAAKELNVLEWLYEEVFLYIDEFHCYATEAFREHILSPFEWIWNFKKLAFGSATPFNYSCSKFDDLPRYKLLYKEKFGTITIIDDPCPQSVLNYMLTHPDMFPGKVHIFFNSVTQCGEAVRNANIKDVAIFCRDDERNIKNLADAKQYFHVQPRKELFKKFNFYSARYNEGWNLDDNETATMILVTDVKINHTLAGIPYKGFQAVGRLNVKPDKIYHITNNFAGKPAKQFEEVKKTCLYNSNAYISQYNAHNLNCKKDKIENDYRSKEMIQPFSTFNAEGYAEIDHMRQDQIICAKYTKQQYNNIDIIENAWKSVNYDTDIQHFDLTPLVRNGRNFADINKQVIERMVEWKTDKNQYMFEPAHITMAKSKIEFELLFQAVEILGIDEIAKLGYENKAMKKALIKISNENGEAKLRLKIIEEFKIGDRYTKSQLKERLQQLYNEFGIMKDDGTTKVAKATDIETLGLFLMNECKVKTGQGESKNGFELTTALYKVKNIA